MDDKCSIVRNVVAPLKLFEEITGNIFEYTMIYRILVFM